MFQNSSIVKNVRFLALPVFIFQKLKYPYNCKKLQSRGRRGEIGAVGPLRGGELVSTDFGRLPDPSSLVAAQARFHVLERDSK